MKKNMCPPLNAFPKDIMYLGHTGMVDLPYFCAHHNPLALVSDKCVFAMMHNCWSPLSLYGAVMLVQQQNMNVMYM